MDLALFYYREDLRWQGMVAEASVSGAVAPAHRPDASNGRRHIRVLEWRVCLFLRQWPSHPQKTLAVSRADKDHPVAGKTELRCQSRRGAHSPTEQWRKQAFAIAPTVHPHIDSQRQSPTSQWAPIPSCPAVNPAHFLVGFINWCLFLEFTFDSKAEGYGLCRAKISHCWLMGQWHFEAQLEIIEQRLLVPRPKLTFNSAQT